MSPESKTAQDFLRVSGGRREVSASVAAEILRVTAQTIQRWVKGNLLDGRVDNTGHVFVDVEALKPAVEIDAALPFLPSTATDLSSDDVNAEVRMIRAEHAAR